MALQKATFAGGCFWGVQHYFDQIPGVIKSRTGYTGGHTDNPTYEQVCSQATGHAEATELEYDSDLVNFDTLVKHFFRMHDPTQLNRQGPDEGDQYRSAIFYHNEDQKIVSEIVMADLATKYKDKIVTKLEPAGIFYEAEPHHQKYTETNGHDMCHIPFEPFQ